MSASTNILFLTKYNQYELILKHRFSSLNKRDESITQRKYTNKTINVKLTLISVYSFILRCKHLYISLYQQQITILVNVRNAI